MPAAWDRTASGPSDCATKVSDCTAVYNYLAGQAKDLTSLRDLAAVEHRGRAVEAQRVQRRRAHHVRAEQVLLRPGQAEAGRVPGGAVHHRHRRVQRAALAECRHQDQTSATCPTRTPRPSRPTQAVGTNPLSGYTLAPLYPWGIDYYAMNYQSNISDHGAIFKQLYFRQALAYLFNQAAIISGPLRGYGEPTVGPVAATPATKFLSATGRKGDPFPYQPDQGQEPADQPRLERGPERRRPPAPTRPSAARGSPRAARSASATSTSPGSAGSSRP